MTDEHTTKIRELNDTFRKTGEGGQVYITRGLLQTFDAVDLVAIDLKLKQFDDFTEDNDPYQEHDFGTLHHKGEKLFWKIDYYSNHSPNKGSEDPSNPECTKRILTIMLAEEY